LIHEIQRLTKDKADGHIIPIQRADGTLITPSDILEVIREVH
jgi:2-oxoglutarate ferredoxin oxidoreductase subunit alpha